MNLNVSTIVNLSEKDVKSIIKEYLENQGYKVCGDVKINISSRIEGYGMNEHNVTSFTGATVNVTT
jgi:hypothetical protein